jgi:hypothetical protein
MKEGAPAKVDSVTFVGKNTTLTVSKEEYVPPPLQPETVEGHEALHSGVGRIPKWVSARPGPGYLGITVFGDTPGVEEMLAPAVMGGHGASSDELKAGARGASRSSHGSSVRAKVAENHAEIVEITEDLKAYGSLDSTGVRRARTRGLMKKKFGERATVIAKSADGEEIRISTRVNGDSAAIPTEIINFTKKKEAEDDLKATKNAAQEHEQTDNGEQTTTNEQSVIASFEEIVRAEFAKVEEKAKLASVREQLAQLHAIEAQPVAA